MHWRPWSLMETFLVRTLKNCLLLRSKSPYPLKFLAFHKKVTKFSLLTCHDWRFFNVSWLSFWFFMLHKDWKLETKNLNTRILMLFFLVQSWYNWSPIVLKKVSISLQKWSQIGLQLRLFLFSQLVTIPVIKMIVIFVKPKA